MVKERGGAARASRYTEQGEDKVQYYKKRWGIETTLRVQDDAGSR